MILGLGLGLGVDIRVGVGVGVRAGVRVGVGVGVRVGVRGRGRGRVHTWSMASSSGRLGERPWTVGAPEKSTAVHSAAMKAASSPGVLRWPEPRGAL